MPVFEQIMSLMDVLGWAKTRQRNAHNRMGAKAENFCRSFHEEGRFCNLGWRVRRFSMTFRNVLERHR